MQYLVHQMTILGSAGPYGRPIFQFLLVLACLAFGLSIGSLIIILRRGVKSKRQATLRSTASTPIHLLQGKAGRIGKSAGLVIVGIALGWGWRDHQFKHDYAAGYAAWQANWMAPGSQYQKAYAAWAARQPKEHK